MREGGGLRTELQIKQAATHFILRTGLLERQRRRREFVTTQDPAYVERKTLALLCLQIGARRELGCGIHSKHRMDD